MQRRVSLFYWVFQVAILPALLYVNSHATTYYVASNGDDSNPGTTADKPFRTIQKAADIVTTGDIVLIKRGYYAGFRIINKNGTANNYIVFKPFPGDEGQVIIDRYPVAPNHAIQIWSSSYIEISGFHITDSHPEIKLNGTTPIGAINIYDASYVRIINNEIDSFDGNALSASGQYHEIITNHVHDIGALTKLAYAMYMSGSDYVIRGNKIHNTAGIGLCLYPRAERFIVENNTIYDNGSYDFDWKGTPHRAGDGILIYGADNIVRNNLIYNNVDWGIRIRGALVVNNTVYGNGLMGIYAYDNTNSIVRNNISYANRGEAGYPGDAYIGPGNTQDHNLFSVDPKFVDAANGDFRLQAGSPAIDAGIAISGFATDRDGTTRPQGNGWDIGAYEFGGTPSLQAYLSANPASGLVPLTVNFSGNASGGKAPYSYSWDFGDGNTSTLQNPTHTYAQANSYTATLTVADSDNKRATASQTIVVQASSGNVPSVINVKFTEVGQTKELSSLTLNKWYDIYLYVDDPQGWIDINKIDFWLNHESDKTGTISNFGGTFSAASNYVISCAVKRDLMWAKETEGTAAWTEIAGRLGLYVDDDNNEYEINSSEKWAKVRIKLLEQALAGNWTINVYSIDDEQHFSSMLQKNIRVVSIDNQPPAPPINVRVHYDGQ